MQIKQADKPKGDDDGNEERSTTTNKEARTNEGNEKRSTKNGSSDFTLLHVSKVFNFPPIVNSFPYIPDVLQLLKASAVFQTMPMVHIDAYRDSVEQVHSVNHVHYYLLPT